MNLGFRSEYNVRVPRYVINDARRPSFEVAEQRLLPSSGDSPVVSEWLRRTGPEAVLARKYPKHSRLIFWCAGLNDFCSATSRCQDL